MTTTTVIGEGQSSLLARASETLLVTFGVLLFMTGMVSSFSLTPLVVGILQGCLTKPKTFSGTLIVAILSFSIFMFIIAAYASNSGNPVTVDSFVKSNDIFLMPLVIVGLVIGDCLGKFIRRRFIRVLDDTGSDETVDAQQGVEVPEQTGVDEPTHDRRIKLIHGYMRALEPGIGYAVAIITAVLAYLGTR